MPVVLAAKSRSHRLSRASLGEPAALGEHVLEGDRALEVRVLRVAAELDYVRRAHLRAASSQ